jgi:hypothetical protein
MSTQTAELRFRYEIDGNGVRAINELTGEVVKLAKAEDIARERAEAMKKALADSSPNAGRSPLAPPSPRPPSPLPPTDPRTGKPNFNLSPDRLREIPGTRENALLNESYGRGPPQFQAPRPGGWEDRSRAGDPSLARAMGDLTMELRRLPEALRTSLAGVAGTSTDPRIPAAGRSRLAPPRESGIAGPSGREEDSREAQLQSRDRANRMRMGILAGAVSAVSLGGEFARQSAVPFMDDNDRTWSMLRKLQIPGLNVGVSDLRDIQLWLQRMGSGKNVDDEAMKRLGIDSYDPKVRRPLEEFRRQFDPRLRSAERGVLDAYGDDSPLPGIPAMPLREVPRRERFGLAFGREEAERRYQESVREADQQYRDSLAEREKAIAQRLAIEESRRVNGLMPSLPLPGLPGQRRDSLGERQQYEREMSLLPARDRQVLAQRELRMTEATLAEKERLQKFQLDKIREADAIRAAADRMIANQKNPFELMMGHSIRVDSQRMASTHQGQLKALDQEILELKMQAAHQRGGVREADSGLVRAQLDRMRERESIAADQSRSLALIGPAGRAQAEYAMRLIQESGDISMLPPEIVGMAQSAFPKTIGNLAEQAGQKFAGQFRDLAPDEYRDSLPDARKQVDELAAQVRKFEQTNPGQILKDTLDAIRGMASYHERLMQELEKFKQQIDAETRQQNAGK